MKTDIQSFLAGLRIAKPRSRAKGYVTTYGSGSSRRQYACVACGTVVDTESAKYRMTKHAEEAVDAHVAHCPEIGRIITLGRCGHSDCADHPELASACAASVRV